MDISKPNDKLRDVGNWQACPKGTLSELVGQLSVQQRSAKRTTQRRKILVATGLATGVLATGGLGAVLLSSSNAGSKQPGMRENTFGGITCSEVKNNMVAFRDGSLSQDVASKVKLHLAKCSFCQSKMKEMTA